METPDTPTVTFESFGLRAEVLTALKGLGYEEPTPIQRETIPALIAGKDVLGQAATGTGKTAAFALPMMELLDPKERKPFQAQALVLVPTRELAMQVAEAITKYGAGIGVTALAVYGGQEIFNQIRPLKRGVEVVVATPGRALDHIDRKTLQLNKVKFVVLDEADEMLDMGFEEDLQKILGELPSERQTALFSATLAPRIAKIAEKHLNDPVRVTIQAKATAAGTLPSIRQAAYIVQRKFKEAALMRVLEWEQPQSALIFCRTRVEVEELTHVLMRSGYSPAALHGGLTQEQRDGVLNRFKSGAVRVLVATDVAARGLHVENLSHVVNFDLPTSAEVYVHRIGRTGRAGKEGTALSFADPREMRLLQNVERLLKKKVQQLQVPTRAQLDGKRSETVANKVKAAMGDVQSASFMSLAQSAAEGSTMEAVASAAMYLLQQQLFPAHESDATDIPTGRSSDRGPRERSERSDRGERGDRGDRGDRFERGPRGPRAGMTALTLSLGAKAGVRPQDLVGAIANEADLPSKQISGIQVDEFTSRVEVPSDAVQKVMDALHATKIRGRKVRVELASKSPSPPRGVRGEPAARPPRSSAPRRRPEAPVEEPGAVEEAAPAPRASASRARRTEGAPRFGDDRPKFGADRPSFGDPSKRREKPPTEDSAGDAGEKPRFGGDKPRFGGKPSYGDKSGGGDKPRFGDKPAYGDKPRFGDKPSYGDKPRFGGDKPRFGDKSGGGDKPGYGDKPRFGGKPAFGDKPRFGGKPAYGDKPRFGDKPSYGDKPRTGGDKPRFGSDKPRSSGDRPRTFGDKPTGRGRMEPKKR